MTCGRTSPPARARPPRAHQNTRPTTDGALDHRALARVEPVEPRGEQRVDRRRDRDPRQVARRRPAGRRGARAAPSSTSIRSVSSTNSGLPSASSRDPRPRAVGSSSSRPSRFLDQRRRSRAAVSGVERDQRRVRLRRSPSPGGRRAARAARGRASSTGAPRIQSARYSSRSRNVGSPHWMSSNTTTSGRSRAEVLEQLADRPERLLDRRPSPASRPSSGREPLARRARRRRRRRAAARELAPRLARAESRVADPGGVRERRGDRPERDALAVRQAAPRDDGRVVAEPREELVRQPRLADAGRAEDGDELGATARSTARAKTSLEPPRARARGRRAASRGCARPAARAGHDLDAAATRRRGSACP